MIEPSLSDNYRYQYRLALRFGNWEHNYELVDQHGGVHLMLSILGNVRLDHARMFRALAHAADKKFAEHLGQDEEE